MAKSEPNYISQFFTGGVSVVKKIKLGSALDSDIAIVITVVPTLIIAFILTRFWPILIIIIIPIGMYYYHYNYFMKNDKSYLRTEKHEENMYRIQMSGMGEKNSQLSEGAVDVLPSETEVVKKIGINASKNNESQNL